MQERYTSLILCLEVLFYLFMLLLFALDEIHMKPFLIDGDILLTLFNMHMCVDISIFRDGSAGIHQH